jgi:hypothetical protein
MYLYIYIYLFISFTISQTINIPMFIDGSSPSTFQRSILAHVPFEGASFETSRLGRGRCIPRLRGVVTWR